ncbi:hypothetical protein WJ971_19285 [Achromobacter xylosoxidans]
MRWPWPWQFPALAGGYRGGHHGGYHHHHGGGGGGSGWWIGGAFALAATGLILAANSGPSYAQTGVYAPGVSYTSPPVYAAPVYETPPVYSAPRSTRSRRNTRRCNTRRRPANTAQASASTDCQRWAMNQSGYDPATISQWTTQVMVDSYNHAMDSCMNSRGYRAN